MNRLVALCCLFGLVFCGYAADFSEQRASLQGSLGTRSEVALALRHTGAWGLYAEVNGGLRFLDAPDHTSFPDRLESVLAVSPAVEVGAQLLQGNSLGWELYAGAMPWGRIIDNSTTDQSVFANKAIRWEPEQFWGGSRLTVKRAAPQHFFWSLGVFAELGYTRFRIQYPTVSWTASGFALRAGISMATGFRLGAQPVEHSLAWSVRKNFQDSVQYRRFELEKGLVSADINIRRATLVLVTDQGRIADFIVEEKNAQLQKEAMARIKDPALRAQLLRYLTAKLVQ